MLQHRTATHSNFSELPAAKIGSKLLSLLCLWLIAMDSSQSRVSRETPHSQKKLTKQIFPIRPDVSYDSRSEGEPPWPTRFVQPASPAASPLQPEHPSPPGAPVVLGAPGTAEPLPATRPANKGALPPPESAARPQERSQKRLFELHRLALSERIHHLSLTLKASSRGFFWFSQDFFCRFPPEAWGMLRPRSSGTHLGRCRGRAGRAVPAPAAPCCNAEQSGGTPSRIYEFLGWERLGGKRGKKRKSTEKGGKKNQSKTTFPEAITNWRKKTESERGSWDERELLRFEWAALSHRSEPAGVPLRFRGRRKPCEDRCRLPSFLLCFNIQPTATQWSEIEGENATTLHEKGIRNSLKCEISARCRHSPSLRGKQGNGARPRSFKQSSWKTCLPGVWNRSSRAAEKRDSPLEQPGSRSPPQKTENEKSDRKTAPRREF